MKTTNMMASLLFVLFFTTTAVANETAAGDVTATQNEDVAA